MALPIPVWITKSANFFLRNQLQFSRGIQCVSHPVSTLSSNILRLEQPTCLSYTVSYRFVCWHQASISHSLHSPKSVPIQRYQFRHLSSLLPPRSFKSLMRIKVVLLRHESLEKWRGWSFLLWLCFDSKQTTPILWGLLFQSSIQHLSYTR